ncbi:MAG: ATP-binding protein [Thiolinea sp.]
MIRLLATLNIMLIIVLFGYVFLVNSSLNTVLQIPTEGYYQRLGQGTHQLLNASVAGLDAQARGKKVAALQQQFGYPLRLLPLDELAMSARQTARLEQGLVVNRKIDDTDYLYGLLPESTLVWEVALDQSRVADEVKTTAGTFFLLQQAFAGQPEATWPDIMKTLQAQFGFPLTLYPMQAVKLEQEQRRRLEAGETVVVLQGEFEEVSYQRLADSNYALQIGVISPPWFGRYLNQLIAAVLVFILLLSSTFWLWPLWRNLLQIRNAAEAFGRGEYGTRVPHRKHSRLAVVTEAFNAMAERTQNSIRAQKELTTAVSHELRTPVARMRFALDMLSGSHDPAEKQRYLDSMNLDIDELDTLLEELLTYARFDQAGQKLQRQWVPLAAWLEQAMTGLQLLAGDKMLNRRCENISPQTEAWLEPVLMQRVLNNLVQNALRHAQSRVEVLLWQEGSDFLLQVDDDGPGIPLHERERLFEAFAVQEDSRNKALAGFGLGLAIVKRIVESHQGEVAIAEAELGGARFLVRWPVSATAENEWGVD